MQSSQSQRAQPPSVPAAVARPSGASRRVLVLFAVFLVVLLAAVAEIGARLMGAQPWRPLEPGVTVSPENRFFESDPILGWTHLPGEFKVTLHDGFAFNVTHTSDTLRITRPLVQYAGDIPARPSIWILGCSFTHGWSVNDDQTYPWLLQERMPAYDIANFGCSGYGVLQSLMQFREALKSKSAPEVAVLGYGSFLDERSTFTRNRRKNSAAWNYLGQVFLPYARLGENGKLDVQYTELTYTPFPLMRHSAFMHLLEQAWNRLEEKRLKSHQVNDILLKEFKDVCEENGVTPAVAIILPSPEAVETLGYCQSLGIAVASIAPDDIYEREAQYSNMPHDPHPSPLLQRNYAENLHRFLKQVIDVE